MQQPEPSRRSWREGQKLYGPIRAGQYWKKRDTGRIGRIVSKAEGTCWRIDIGTQNHKTDMRDIYRFHDRVK